MRPTSGVLVPMFAAAVFAALSLWAAVSSEGFLEADSCTHYLYARFAVGEPHYLVNVWGRPFATAVYAVPAALWGRMGVRVTSLLLALGTAAVAYRIARLQRFRWPELAFVFLLAQPLVFLHSFSELTELPFALLLALAYSAYVRKQWFVMALLAGLLPTARPEGFLFVLLAAAALVWEGIMQLSIVNWRGFRSFVYLLILPVPLVVWDYAGWVLYGRPHYSDALPESLQWILWLKAQWPYAQESAYARGHLLHFVWFLPAIVGPLVFPALLIGIWRQIRTSQALVPLMILVAHSVLFALGKMASNGELRYMLIVAAFWALLAARGWEWVFDKMRWRAPVLWAGVAAALPVLVQVYYPVLPLKLSDEWEQVREIARWYREGDVSKQYPRLLVSHPAYYYFMDISPTDGGRMLIWSKQSVTKQPPGTLLIWDPTYGLLNSDRQRIVSVEEISAAGWIEAERWGEFRIFRSARSMERGGMGEMPMLRKSPAPQEQ